MSFFGKLKGVSSPAGLSGNSSSKKDPNAPQPTLLEQRLADATGPVRTDGSDKFFGFENYGSTCYCNSIIQCLYYSAPFRENILNYPSKAFLDNVRIKQPNGTLSHLPTSPPSTYPNPTSPARKVPMPTSPGGIARAEDSKDSPEYKKRQALSAGPVLDMIQDNSSKYGVNESLFTSLRDIFEAIIGHQSRIGVVSPHRFLEILRRDNEMFRSAMHQDAHEFLNLLLNQVVDSVDLFAKQHPSALSLPIANGGAPEKTSAIDMAVSPQGLHLPTNSPGAHWVHDLFEGLLTSETRCLTCETTSQRDEAFLDLSVDLSAHTSVTSCLRKFSEEEMLCERNKFHCDNCGGLQEAEKRMKIKRLPRILALHLKRFKYTEDLQRLQKLFHRVVYPFHLRLFNTTDDAEDPDRLYELYAVVVHIGGGPYHGHYVSIIKTQDRGWLLFDDEMVEPVDKSYVLNFFGGEPVPGVQDAKQLACAYVLFYQETTLEAMLREQESEGQPASGRVSDAETAKDSISSPILRSTTNITTPIGEDVPPLAHAVTAPAVPTPLSPIRSHVEHVAPANSPLLPILPPKSRKELKQEEKDRKAAEKARLKAEEQAVVEKHRQAVNRRIDAWRKADDQMKQVLEISKQTAAADQMRFRATSAGAAEFPVHHTPLSPPLPQSVDHSAATNAATTTGTKEKESSLSRFRNGNLSLRGKTRLFSSSKDKVPPPPPVPVGASGAPANGMTLTSAPAGSHDEPATSLSSTLASPSEGRKMRFSLGRKKSAGLS